MPIKQVDIAGLHCRRASPSDAGSPPVLMLHGFPETSMMWEGLLEAAASAGHEALAPDLPGYGSSPPDLPATWERLIAAIDRLIDALGWERLVIVVHDWGGLIGLRWACENPEKVAGMLIADTGLFPDGEWHGMAKVIRTPGEGEKLIEGLTRESFGQLIAAVAPHMPDELIEDYWRGFETEAGRQTALDMYRSGDFEKLEPYAGRLAAIDAPAEIVWGEKDAFAPLPGAYRFAKELADAELTVLVGAGHFIFSERPTECRQALGRLLARIRG